MMSTSPAVGFEERKSEPTPEKKAHVPKINLEKLRQSAQKPSNPLKHSKSSAKQKLNDLVDSDTNDKNDDFEFDQKK